MYNLFNYTYINKRKYTIFLSNNLDNNDLDDNDLDNNDLLNVDTNNIDKMSLDEIKQKVIALLLKIENKDQCVQIFSHLLSSQKNID